LGVVSGSISVVSCWSGVLNRTIHDGFCSNAVGLKSIHDGFRWILDGNRWKSVGNRDKTDRFLAISDGNRPEYARFHEKTVGDRTKTVGFDGQTVVLSAKTDALRWIIDEFRPRTDEYRSINDAFAYRRWGSRLGQSAHTHAGAKATASHAMTDRPRGERILTPMGATGIGRQGRKKRYEVHGQRSATPRPPSVMASSKPCEMATAAATIPKSRQRGVRRMSHVAAAAPRSATAIECVAPRCPQVAP
jgi:hypothetical protein